MFGRSSDTVAPVQPAPDAGEPGGRAAAISILPGTPLPPGLLVATPVAPALEPFAGASDPADERELVSVGAEHAGGGSAFGVGTLTPPPPAPGAPAKRKSFSGLRRKGKAPEPVAPAGFFGDDLAEGVLAPASDFRPAEPAEVPAPAEPDATHEAHVLTEVHVVAEPAAPLAPSPAPSVPTSFHPTAPAAPIDDLAMFPSTIEDDEPATFGFSPTTDSPPAAPPAYLPPVPPTPVDAVPAASVVDEDPLFHHVPVLSGRDVNESVPVAPEPVAPAPAARPTFLNRLRALRPAPADAATEAPAAVDAPPAFAPPVPGAVQPPPYVPFSPPASAAPAPAYVPLGTPAADQYAPAATELPTEPSATPPVEVAAPIPAFGNLVPTQPPAPTVGLVFADGSTAELPDGPEGAALQHVAKVLAGEDASSAEASGSNGPAAPIE